MNWKSIWIQVLLAGILSSIASCTTQVDGRYERTYSLINRSGSNVYIESFYNNIGSKGNDTIVKYEYFIHNDSILIQNIDLYIGNVAGTIALSDSLSITFGENYQVHFVPTDTVSPFNILNSSNYDVDRVEYNHEILTYTFSEVDVSNAKEN